MGKLYFMQAIKKKINSNVQGFPFIIVSREMCWGKEEKGG